MSIFCALATALCQKRSIVFYCIKRNFAYVKTKNRARVGGLFKCINKDPAKSINTALRMAFFKPNVRPFFSYTSVQAKRSGLWKKSFEQKNFREKIFIFFLLKWFFHKPDLWPEQKVGKNGMNIIFNKCQSNVFSKNQLFNQHLDFWPKFFTKKKPFQFLINISIFDRNGILHMTKPTKSGNLFKCINKDPAKPINTVILCF